MLIILPGLAGSNKTGIFDIKDSLAVVSEVYCIVLNNLKILIDSRISANTSIKLEPALVGIIIMTWIN